MTHLNTFSYPSRLAITVLSTFFLVCLSILFRYNFLTSFKKSVKKKKLPNVKFFAYLLLLVILGSWLIYDIIAFVENYFFPASDSRFATANQVMSMIADVILNITFTAHASLMFLLGAYQNSVIHQFGATDNFWRGCEFKVYIAHSIISLVFYPAIQWAMVFNRLLFTIVPQLVYTAQLTLSSMLFWFICIRWKRFQRTVKVEGTLNRVISNLVIGLTLVSICNMVTGWTLGIINICYLAEPGMQRDLHHSIGPFGKDLLTSFFSVSYCGLTVLTMFVLNVGQITKMLEHQSPKRVQQPVVETVQQRSANSGLPTSFSLEKQISSARRDKRRSQLIMKAIEGSVASSLPGTPGSFLVEAGDATATPELRELRQMESESSIIGMERLVETPTMEDSPKLDNSRQIELSIVNTTDN